ncbi:hypothetical protein B0H19DRAFT_966575 [Mycena capillaripes]|nr:hypothetical protein B0H19DRAFT_966575 [Mycena capillaripes]
MSYVPQVDLDALMTASTAGIAAIRAGLDEKRAFTKEAKLFCDRCKKQETSASPLQACSRCRSVWYCSRECQVAHYKMTHKKACADFVDPPLCRAFNTKVPLPGCSYPEVPVFARGVSEGMGAWLSVAGSIDCRLATLPGGLKARPARDAASMQEVMAMIPGMMDGKYLALNILVQNRTLKAKPMVVIGKGIVAVASPRGTPIFLEGKDHGEPSRMLEYPHLGPVLGLAKTSAEVTHFNGKAVKENGSLPSAVKDADTCAVLLNVGEYAMFTVEFRAGGPKVTHDFQALELLEHIIVPAIPYDPKAKGPYSKLLPEAADRDEVCEIRAKIDQGAVEAWFKDYKTKGERAHIISHYGEARANMIGEGNQHLGEMLKAMASMAGLNLD